MFRNDLRRCGTIPEHGAAAHPQVLKKQTRTHYLKTSALPNNLSFLLWVYEIQLTFYVFRNPSALAVRLSSRCDDLRVWACGPV
jgi:hypothetical protein